MKLKVIKKYDGSDIYLFVGGVAVVPGCWYLGSPMKVTLKEFNDLKRRR